MAKYRKRFNEKARAGMVAKQNALKSVRQRQFTRHLDNQPASAVVEEATHDPNAEILIPVSKEEQEERKKRLHEQVYADKPESKLSRNKRKRLDKYIEHQLKREEKKALLEKLQDTKIDTSILKPSKLLGTGKQTKREAFQEALRLEQQGRGDDETKSVLYEEREVKEWKDSDLFQQPSKGDEPTSDRESNDEPSGFVDNRPSKFGGFGSFAFSNLPKVAKAPQKKKYNWKTKLALDELKRSKEEDAMDFLSSEGSEDGETSGDEDVEEGETSGDEDVEERENFEEEDVEEEEKRSQENGDFENESEEFTGFDDHVEGPEGLNDVSNGVEGESDEESDSHQETTSRGQSFKEWAEERAREVEQRPVTLPPTMTMPQIPYEPIVREEDLENTHLESDEVPVNPDLKRKVHYVSLDRPHEIQEQRMKLPVFAEEHRIMEAIHNHPCVILCGETGSGKTTQVPQFLYESGYGSSESEDTPGMIGVTQPRRVAAMAMAERVGTELGSHKQKVGYQIRFDSRVSQDTKIKFMTDGVLLREMMADFLLSKYSCIIIDEAHERNMNTDVLIGMLSRVLKLRAKYHNNDPKKFKLLKLVIMSATLRVTDFSENGRLFPSEPPPVITVPARQFPVSVHFNKRTAFNYMEEAFRKTCKIHRKLPPGGILVFLTGQNEISALVKQLRKEFPSPSRYGSSAQVKVDARNADTEAEEVDFSVKVDEMDEVDEDDFPNEEEDNEEGFDEQLQEGQSPSDPLYVLPLYSLLPTSEQMKVFQDPPKGARVCIVATNVAETSITIPGIRYVVDCGRAKERHLNRETGVTSFEVDWISKASASQRSGRAGRTGPGHCYRLYSSAVFETDFPLFSEPEICKMPVESVVLSMKSMGIHNVVNFPFPTPPPTESLLGAVKLLRYLGAFDADGTLTDLGKQMSLFPLSPRFSKMLIVGNQHGCLPYVIALVSGLSVGDPFIQDSELHFDDDTVSVKEQEEKKSLKTRFNKAQKVFSQLDPKVDMFKLLSAICAFDHVAADSQTDFLQEHFLRPKVMQEIHKLRSQLAYIVKVNTTKEGIASGESKQKALSPPTKIQLSALKQILVSGFIDQLSVRADLADSDTKIVNRSKIGQIPYAPLFPVKKKHDDSVDKYVYIHPASVLNASGELPPSYLCYMTLNRAQSKQTVTEEGDIVQAKVDKVKMKPLTDISGKALANVGKKSGLITYSKPLGHPYAPVTLSSTKRECYVVPRMGAVNGESGVGWDLPPIKTVQNKVGGVWVNE